jgi:hypothetical protein
MTRGKRAAWAASNASSTAEAAVRPGYVAEPDKAGKRRIRETGLFGLTPKQLFKWTRRHVTWAKVAETLQRGQIGHVNRDKVIGALRRSRV